MRARLGDLVRGRDRTADLDEEVAHHLASIQDELRSDGMSDRDAANAARKTFGNVTLARERSVDAWVFRWLDDLVRDVRFGMRTLWRDRSLASVIVLILAVGIGSATAIYSLVDACLLHSNNYPVVDRWVVVRTHLPETHTISNYLSVPELNDVAALTDVFDDVGAVTGGSFTLSEGDFPERVLGTRVSADVIPATGVEPILGRTFRPEEDRPGGPLVVVLSYELWREKFGGDLHALGRAIRLDGQTYTVVGVMPAHYGLWGGRLWVPMQLDRGQTDRSARRFWIVAVTHKGLTEGQVNARLRVLAARLDREFGRSHPEYAGVELKVWNINEAVIGGIRPALLVMLGAVGLLLLLSCANVASLLLARATARTREMSVRATLGAGRFRLIRQMLTESLILSAAGGVAGVLASASVLPLLVRLIPPEYLTTDAELVRVNGVATALAVLLSAGVGLFFGLVPALRSSGDQLSGDLRRRGGGAHHRARRMQQLLMTAEVAIALVVMIGAALIVRSYRNAESIALGFKPDGLLTFNVALPPGRYATEPQAAAFFTQVLDRLAAIPHVSGAGAISGLPMAYRTVDMYALDFTIEGRPVENGRAPLNASFRVVSADYFRVAGTPVVRGRALDAHDGRDAPLVAVINETMGQLFWPGHDPIGASLHLGNRYGRRDGVVSSGPSSDSAEPVVTVVGVVRDSKQVRAIDAPVRPEIFLPLPQRANDIRIMAVVMRSDGDLRALVEPARRAIREVDAEQPIYDVDTLSNVVADSFGPKRLTLMVLGFFAVVGFTLAAIGLYALVSYSVSQRSHEIGVRLAIGARPWAIVALVMRQGLTIALAGVLVGVVVAAIGTRMMTSELYGVSATDPLVFVVVAVALVAVAAAASGIPARRATRVDPLIALRTE
jgi:putative ABC transport system permease protein